MNKKELYIFLGIIAVGIAIFVDALFFPHFSAKIMPAVISGLMTFLGILGVIGTLRTKKQAKPVNASSETEKSEDDNDEFQWRDYLKPAIWVTGYILAVTLIGFLIASPVFLAGYIRSHAGSWKQTIITTVITELAIYGIFIVIFKVTLFEGFLFGAR